MKRSTATAVQRMEAAKILEDMAFGSDNCIATRRKMVKESSRMEPWPQHQTPDIQTSGKTRKEVG